MSTHNINRRNFIRSTALAGGAAVLPFSIPATAQAKHTQTTTIGNDMMKMKNPLAIAMWDYSWMLRHHKYGDFENWDEVLDGMVERGYNALRIDCFPHLIAADKKGKIEESFLHVREAWKPAFWGNDFTMRSHPRQDLVEFMKKCKERNIYIGLSTWFMPHGTKRNEETQSTSDFIRVWNETLEFVNENDLMDIVIYVDLLNEYPLWHGLEWFKKEMNQRGNEKLFKENNPDANVPDEVFEQRKNGGYTKFQAEFFQSFIDDTITALKAKWSGIPFFASFPGAANLYSVDVSKFGAIDPHYWFSHHGDLNKKTGVANLHMFRSEKQSHFEENYQMVLKYWDTNLTELTNWMEGRIKAAAELGKKHDIPVGNTEGWGSVFWQDHPLTGWEFIKNAADVSVDLAVKHGYKFICTSNFCHPQFKGMWRDVEWHKQITKRIKNT